VLANELLVMTPAVANSIREGRPSAVSNAIHGGREAGMVTLEASLASLVPKRQITLEQALNAARNRETPQVLLRARAVA
jgi:twitching motility protein PilT